MLNLLKSELRLIAKKRKVCQKSMVTKVCQKMN